MYLCSVQEFWRTCDETKAWINEKDIAFSSEDCGKDLASVQLLQRKQQVHILYVYNKTTYISICTYTYVTGFAKTDQIVTRTDQNPICSLAL